MSSPALGGLTSVVERKPKTALLRRDLVHKRAAGNQKADEWAEIAAGEPGA